MYLLKLAHVLLSGDLEKSPFFLHPKLLTQAGSLLSFHRVVTWWIHPISGKRGGWDVQPSCEAELLAAHHVVPLPPWKWRAVREGDDSQRAAWAATALDRGSLLGHWDTAESFLWGVHVWQAAFDSYSDETDGEIVNWIFHFFPMCFNQNDSIRIWSLQAERNPISHFDIFSFIWINDQFRMTLCTSKLLSNSNLTKKIFWACH